MRTPLRAIVMAVSSVLLFSIMAALVKYAQQSLPSQQVVFWRSMVGALILLPLVLRERPWLGCNRKLLVLRGCVGFLGLSGTYYAISRLSLVDAILIFQATPIFVMPLSAFFLKERIRPVEWVFTLSGLAGVALVIKPTGAISVVPALIGLGGAFFAAAAYVTVRALGRSERTSVIVFYYSLAATLGTTPGLVVDPVWPALPVALALVGIAMVSTLAQGLMTIAYRLATARKVVIINYLGVPLAAAWGFFIWGEMPDRWTIIGTVLVIISLVLMELVRDRQAEVGAVVREVKSSVAR